MPFFRNSIPTIRSIIAHLKNARIQDVRTWLDSFATRYSADDNWYVQVGDDTILYIYFYDDWESEFELEDYAALVAVLGTFPSVGVIANVSGRIEGTPEATHFATSILSQFEGVVQDDYTEHSWTLAELLANTTINNIKFFNYLEH